MRIIFMGTPDFAVPSLSLLLAHHYNIVAVITAPDKPRGRGQLITYSPIKQLALQHNLPILQPNNLLDANFLQTLQSYQADLQVVVAFRMLPTCVWAMPPLGTFNLHASLLPQYRGAAPINWAIIHGEKETGITTFFLDKKMDTGQIILQKKEKITEKDTAGTLYQRLMHQGASLVIKTVQSIVQDTYVAHPQPTKTALHKTAPKIYKQDCQINWKNSTQQIYNFVRGLAPYPGAYTLFNQQQIKILAVEQISLPKKNSTAGTYYSDSKRYIYVGTLDGLISIQILQPPGKKPMSIQAFLQGNKINSPFQVYNYD